MEPSGYPGLTEVEAIRHLYVSRFLEQSYTRRDKPVLLVAGTGFADETTSLLSMLYAALPDSTSLGIWIKPHPSQPVGTLLEGINIDVQESGYKVVEQPIPELFPDVTAVMTASSSIAVEALAFGCEVIVPFFSDYICMNPLVGICEYYHSVFSPEDLRSVVERIANGERKAPPEDYRELVRGYWNLDNRLKSWDNLLSVPERDLPPSVVF